MDTSKVKSNSFFVALAHLFYAVAMVDNKMVIEEKRKIVSYVKKYWSPTFTGIDSDEIVYQTMRDLIKTQTTSEDAYQDFAVYYRNNTSKFSKESCQQIMEAADSIATSFSKRNKSELILLVKLHKLLFESKD